MEQFNRELLQIVLAKRFVKNFNEQKLLEISRKEKIPLLKVMVREGLLSEEHALSVLSEYYHIPSVDFEMLEISKELTELYSFSFIRKHKMVPVSIDEKGVLLVALSDPSDYFALSAVSAIHGGNLDLILVRENQIAKYIDSVVAVKSTALALKDLQKEKTAVSSKDAQDAAESAEREENVINAPAVRLVDSIIREAIPFRASDIHIEPFEKIVKVRYRIDGVLADRAEFPILSYPAVCARLKIMSGINIAERRIPQDGRINMEINGSEIDMRVSTLPTVYGEKFVVRILDKTSFSFTRKDLAFTKAENVTVDKILAHPHGILLITGPTGCGKSTTLYSFIKEINKPGVNIITVEDPVEYTLHGINQTQVNIKANLTFATALRSILRQDPNIIMIGEIRDEETAQIAIRAAITGHLVFSTLHTNDAPGSISRLEDMGVKHYLVADALVGVISQRLIKKLCPKCKKRSKTDNYEMEMMKLDAPKTIYRPKGCQFCNNSGYKGRIAVHEVMYNNQELKNAINERKDLEELRQIAKKGGMVELFENCREYVLNGITSIEELMSLYVD